MEQTDLNCAKLLFASQESLKIYDSERTDLIAAKDNALQELDLARRFAFGNRLRKRIYSAFLPHIVIALRKQELFNLDIQGTRQSCPSPRKTFRSGWKRVGRRRKRRRRRKTQRWLRKMPRKSRSSTPCKNSIPPWKRSWKSRIRYSET